MALAAMLGAWLCLAGPAMCQGAPQNAPSGTALADPAPKRTRTAVATRVTAEIVVDGALDETAWRSAPRIGDLVQRIPRAGSKPTERTDVTILYDKDNLYIGVMCYDSEPAQVLASQMVRDASLNADDRLSILLDTFRDQRSGFHFATNPAGALVDGLVFANGETNNEWDAIWLVKTRRTHQGWSAEFAIPFKTLSFPEGRTTWGFNISRTVQRTLEEARWTGWDFQTQFFQVSEAGELTGLDGIEQGIGLDVRPFGTQRWQHTGRTGNDAVTGKFGADLFYNITPSLKLTGTVNTDFGETEVDQRQINLTRFSIFFPEKRSFFLQDAGVFGFATTGVVQPGGIPSPGAEVFPFFSRRIGLRNGQEVPIDYGLKLTGRVGRTEVGVLNMRTRAMGDLDARDLFVARVKQNFFEQSYVGAIVSGGNPDEASSSSMYGADMRLATSNFLGSNQNMMVNAFALKSNNQGVKTNNASYGFAAQYPNDRYAAQFMWREIQDNFDPALGFVQRRNVRMMRVGGSFNPRPSKKVGVQQMFHDVTTRGSRGSTTGWWRRGT